MITLNKYLLKVTFGCYYYILLPIVIKFCCKYRSKGLLTVISPYPPFTKLLCLAQPRLNHIRLTRSIPVSRIALLDPHLLLIFVFVQTFYLFVFYICIALYRTNTISIR